MLALKHFAKYLIAAAALAVCTSCGDDDNDPTPVTPVVDVTLEWTNPGQGAVVDPDEISEIQLSFSGNVTVDPNVQATLNGRNVRLVAAGSMVTLPVSLEKNMNYSLVIPDRMIISNKGLAYVGGITLSFSTGDAVEVPSNFAPLTNASATAQARNVYNFICQTSGKKIISGAMANVNNNNDFAEWVNRVSGKYPALTGYDFIHLTDSRPGAWIDYSDISPARSQWEANGLVSYMWHWNVPNSEAAWRSGDTDQYGYNVGGDSNVTSFDIREALKEGTWQNQCILAHIDKVAGYLKLLQEAGIPVLWRPLHEAAGNYSGSGAWFWWGRYGDEYTIALWKLMHDRLVDHHGLNNLIWVWTAQYLKGYEEQMKASYPGDEYVDIVGIDIYADSDASHSEAYNAGLALTGGMKPVSLSECGLVPSPSACIADGAAWAWFMIWYTYDINNGSASADGFGNTAESLRAVMNNSLVITRDIMPSLK